MSRLDEVDVFLKNISKRVQTNSNFNFDSKNFYNLLMSYDISNEEFRQTISNNFDGWSRRYKDSNLDVFVSPLQRRFLQFQNNNDAFTTGVYKLYLSFPKNKIVDCVNIIFDFIEKNNIVNFSKVADIIRSDSVVLRIHNSNDMKKVVNYINNNRFLVENANRTNPFLMRNGIVGFAYDNGESFNSVISSMLGAYFNEVKNNNRYDEVSRMDFVKFMDRIYNNTFINMKNLDNFNKNMDFAYQKYYSDEDKLLNFKQIIEFITYSNRGNFSLDDYSLFINNSKDIRKNNAIKEIFRDNLYKVCNYKEIENLFFDACFFTCKKYNKNQLYYALVKACNGNFESFSNGDFLYRKKLKSFVPSSQIEILCKNFLDRDLVSINDEDDLLKEFSEYINDFVKQTERERI